MAGSWQRLADEALGLAWKKPIHQMSIAQVGIEKVELLLLALAGKAERRRAHVERAAVAVMMMMWPWWIRSSVRGR
jgi:hypothetical protein